MQRLAELDRPLLAAGGEKFGLDPVQRFRAAVPRLIHLRLPITFDPA